MFGFILLHSTGDKPNNSKVDVALTYADYYFLEALLRWQAKKIMRRTFLSDWACAYNTLIFSVLRSNCGSGYFV